MRELLDDMQVMIQKPSPFVWFGLGMFLVLVAATKQTGIEVPYLNMNPTLIGLVLGFSFAAMIVSIHNRPQSRSNTIVFVGVCFVFASHGLWWYPFWEIMATGFENQLRTLMPRTSYIRYLYIGKGGSVFGGLILISVFLCWPIWMLTHSRIARTACLLAGPLAGAMYVGSGWGSMRCRRTFMDNVSDALDQPMFLWYVMVFLPIAVLAQISRPSPLEEGICPSCGHSLEGLPQGVPCPECGKSLFEPEPNQ